MFYLTMHLDINTSVNKMLTDYLTMHLFLSQVIIGFECMVTHRITSWWCWLFALSCEGKIGEAHKIYWVEFYIHPEQDKADNQHH